MRLSHAHRYLNGFLVGGSSLLLGFSLLLAHDIFALEPLLPVPIAEASPYPLLSEIQKPKRIIIPSIKVDGKVEEVTITKRGSMDVPKDPMRAGWYSLGTKPGTKGSAVLAGHVNWWNGRTGIFEHLKNVKPGETIIIEDEAGNLLTFVITETKKIHRTADARAIFQSADNKAHLNLITCGGSWDRLVGQYTERFIVFAERI